MHKIIENIFGYKTRKTEKYKKVFRHKTSMTKVITFQILSQCNEAIRTTLTLKL